MKIEKGLLQNQFKKCMQMKSYLIIVIWTLTGFT